MPGKFPSYFHLNSLCRGVKGFRRSKGVIEWDFPILLFLILILIHSPSRRAHWKPPRQEWNTLKSLSLISFPFLSSFFLPFSLRISTEGSRERGERSGSERWILTRLRDYRVNYMGIFPSFSNFFVLLFSILFYFIIYLQNKGKRRGKGRKKREYYMIMDTASVHFPSLLCPSLAVA